MIKIRRNVFETNSSSTHSIAIPKDTSKDYRGRTVYFYMGEYGWEFDEPDPASYLYTAINCFWASEPDIREEKLNFLKNTLEKHGINYTMPEVKFEEAWKNKETGRQYYNPEHGYIDHDHELGEFLEAVFRDEDTLLSFIFDGLVYTGNDNSDSLACFPQQRFGEEYAGKDKGWVQVENEYYDPNSVNFNWYVKGN